MENPLKNGMQPIQSRSYAIPHNKLEASKIYGIPTEQIEYPQNKQKVLRSNENTLQHLKFPKNKWR